MNLGRDNWVYIFFFLLSLLDMDVIAISNVFIQNGSLRFISESSES